MAKAKGPTTTYSQADLRDKLTEFADVTADLIAMCAVPGVPATHVEHVKKTTQSISSSLQTELSRKRVVLSVEDFPAESA